MHEPEVPGNGVAAGEELPLKERLHKEMDRLLASADAGQPADEATQRVMEDTLARALQAEDSLARSLRRLEGLESQNIFDEITGLLNRRGFDNALRRGLARARRYGETGALLLVDLEQYGEIVETHGAAGGDYVLTAVANIMLRRFRDVDNIARLDGGRFGAQLLLISQEDARWRVAMLKGYLSELEIPWHGADIPVQVRLGLVHYGQGDDAEDLLERAEAELEERRRRIARLRHPA